MKMDDETMLYRLRSNCPFLTKLDLSNQQIKQIKTLTHSLMKNKHLTILNLKNNNIEDDGAILLSEMLYHNTTLLEINLENNNITDRGTRALGKVIEVRPSLKISLIRNFILLGSREDTVYHIIDDAKKE